MYSVITYCLKCKKKTETIDQLETKSSNGRNMVKGICSVCGTKKSVFVSSKDRESVLKTVQGKSFSLNNLIKIYPLSSINTPRKVSMFHVVCSTINRNILSVVQVPDTSRGSARDTRASTS